MNTTSLTPTQQELNVRFHQQVSGRKFGLAINCPNYFAPENFHLVRAAVGELKGGHQVIFFSYLQEALGIFDDVSVHFAISKVFLSPVEHIITAYLKVKEGN